MCAIVLNRSAKAAMIRLWRGMDSDMDTERSGSIVTKIAKEKQRNRP
jgi:hypothetical protein